MTHKRFVLLAGKGGRALAAIAGLTPARADLLLRLSKGPLVQRDIGMELCVGAAVISRMVSALERLGFVKRSRVPGDGRLRLVSLLERATRALNKLYDGFVPDDGTGDIQASAEQSLRMEWEDVLAAHQVRGEISPLGDHRPLLARMLSRIRRTSYHFEWFG